MTNRSTGPACGNNPNYRMSDGDRQAVTDFKAYLADRAALRDRIAQALCTTPREGYDATPAHRTHRYDARCALCAGEADTLADAVLAVLPPTADRAAVLRWAADHIEDHELLPTRDLKFVRGADWALNALRRLADETPAAEMQPEWARPETEDEKLAKARRMAKALSAPPATPSEWATTTEWPNRHKRARDRRVHATAPFEIGGVRRFWTACEKPIGKGGYALSHMPVDCRDCKRATAAGARQDEEA